MTVPCGQCVGCRMARSQDWQTRLYHEGSRHEHSSFLTLTFSDEHLPETGSVCVRDVQLFMKRLRKFLGHRVRYFACGEYGDLNLRPHYHLILFGFDFPDRKPWRKTGSGFVTYRSEQLEKLWPFGQCEIGTVTPESCGYVARYCLKKVNGPAAEDHYTRQNPVTGEIHRVRPEFITMSTRPGIGSDWFGEFGSDAFPSDFVIVNGSRRAVPRYYKKKLDEASAGAITAKRKAEARKRADNNTPERLEVRQEVLERRLVNLQRELDMEQ